MKQELLNILIKLKETNSWDLAWELAIWLYNTKSFKESYVDTIISFLNTASKSAKDKNSINNLIEARNSIINIKKQEILEKEKDFKDIELEINNI